MLKQALSLHQAGRLGEAAALYREILARNPKDADALHLLGVIEIQRKNSSTGIELINRAIAIDPNNAAFFSNRGTALRDLKRLEDALASYDQALAIKPDHADALNNRGNALRDLKRPDDALVSYDRALAVKPDYAEALNSRGMVLRELKRFDAALASYDRALAIKPDHADALNSRGIVLRELKRFDDAIASYDRALAIKPDYAEALNNRGNALQDLKRFDEALVSYDRAAEIKPDYAEALNNRGVALQELKRFDDAIASHDRALVIEPRYADAHYNRGVALQELKRFKDALTSYDHALEIEPDYAFLFGKRLFCRMNICDWDGIGDDFDRLAEKIESADQASPPFAVLATPLTAALQRTNSEIYIREKHPRSSLLPKFEGRYEHDRIRLGYFSADFRNHPVAYLIAELFERHDRGKFEVIAFSFSPPTTNAMATRLKKSFDRFVEASALSDKDVALLARSLEIDIAVDLNGFTQGNRTNIFAMGAAPIQANYLGYAGTMGAGYIDYLIADSTLIPKEQQQHYLEKIVYLPDTYLVNDSKRVIADKRFSKAQSGLPEEGFVFCCFNSTYKITPEVFDVWMRLLRKVEGSVLWLPQSIDAATHNLRMEAKARGVDPARLVFAPFLANMEDHLARLGLGDLFLDTLPYNAHTTASDALWTGLPVLTCLGQTFAGRVAASLLRAVGLPELITPNLDAYEALALQLASNPQKLLSLRQKLAANRLTHPLFDTGRFTKHIESAYVSIWKRHHAGLGPDHIVVQP